MTTPVVCIVGPTASGKSALAEVLAEHFCVPVISVDAMQVYRGMDIGTAKTPPEQRRVELQMVDVCDVNQNYSVDLFQKQARRCVDALLREGRQPILCGGTGCISMLSSMRWSFLLATYKALLVSTIHGF